MTRAPRMQRYCTRCGNRLNSYNGQQFCASCEAAFRQEMTQPPQVPLGFWQTDQMRAALATWHMGLVVSAYRAHPYHGRTLPQELVANWLGLTQAQLSRMEKGPAPEYLSKLIRWAQVLGIPADLLWFKLPGASAATLDGVKRQDFLRAALGVTATSAVAPLMDLLDTIQPTPVPSVVGATEIEQVRQTAHEFSTWDHAYGCGLVREAVGAQLRYAVSFSNASPENDPPWMSYYDVAQHSGDTGHALFDLAVKGRFVTEAKQRLHTAVTGHTDTYVRSRAISGIKLASLTMATGDPLEAATLGTAALVDAGHIRSRRAADDLRELAGFGKQNQRATEVNELRTRIDAVVAGV